MAENLKVTHFRNGSEIADVTGEFPGSGRKYTWHAVSDSNGLCPSGWRAPTINEWRSLINSFGSMDIAARKLEKDFANTGDASQWWSSTEQDTLLAQSFYLNNQTIGIMITASAKTSSLSVRCIREY